MAAEARRETPKISRRDISMTLALGAIVAFFAVREPLFLSSRNLSLLAIELSVTAILALGMLVVLLPGQIDLAAGSGVGLFGGIAAVLVFSHGMSAPLAMFIALALAVGVWTLMGTVIIVERVPSFIITLGGLLVFKGLHWLVIHNQTVPIVEGGKSNLFSLLTTYYLPKPIGFLLAIGIIGVMAWAKISARRRRQAHALRVDDADTTFLSLFAGAQMIMLFVIVANQYRGVPMPAVILGVTVVAIQLVTQHTPFGRYLYAVGGNEDAANLAGVPVRYVVIGAYAIMGGLVALTGFMQTAYSGASTTTVGSLMELDAVAACVIGGTSLRGGRGTVVGTLFGALIMATLLNGMTLLAVPPEIKFVARGAVLALAVWLDVRLGSGR